MTVHSSRLIIFVLFIWMKKFLNMKNNCHLLEKKICEPKVNLQKTYKKTYKNLWKPTKTYKNFRARCPIYKNLQWKGSVGLHPRRRPKVKGQKRKMEVDMLGPPPPPPPSANPAKASEAKSVKRKYWETIFSRNDEFSQILKHL